MRKLLTSLLLFTGLMKLYSQGNQASNAQAVHKKIITIDSHIDIRADFNTAGNDAGKETIDQIDLPKLDKGGLDVATIALFADPDSHSPEAYEAAKRKVEAKYEALQRWVNDHADKLEFAKTTADIERIKKKGKHAILLSFLNAFWFDTNLSLIDSFYNKGVRIFGFDHAGNTAFAGSSRPVAAYGDQPNQGLTELGEKAVSKLNSLGVLIDVSQLSTPAFYKVLEVSKSPVIASHSSSKHFSDAPRNLSDDELKALAAKGGVVQVVAFAGYLKRDSAATQAYLNAIAKPFGLIPLKDDPKAKLSADDYKKYQATYLDFSRNEWRYATLEEYINVVDYVVKLIGVDHVGISSDFNHGGGVTGFANVGEAGNITAELIKRGYNEKDIQKIWGGNFLRILKQAEVARNK